MGQRELKPFSGDSLQANNASSSSPERLGHLRLRRLFQPKATRRREPGQGSPLPPVKTPRSLSAALAPSPCRGFRSKRSAARGDSPAHTPLRSKGSGAHAGGSAGRRGRAWHSGSRGSAGVACRAHAGLGEGKTALSQRSCRCEVLSSYTIPKKLWGNIKVAVKCSSWRG